MVQKLQSKPAELTFDLNESQAEYFGEFGMMLLIVPIEGEVWIDHGGILMKNGKVYDCPFAKLGKETTFREPVYYSKEADNFYFTSDNKGVGELAWKSLRRTPRIKYLSRRWGLCVKLQVLRVNEFLSYSSSERLNYENHALLCDIVNLGLDRAAGGQIDFASSYAWYATFREVK